MPVADILPFFQLAAQIALVVGAVFAGYQFMMHRRQRADQASLEVLTRLASPQFQAAYTHVWDLPIGASADDVRSHGRTMEDAAESVAMTFETIGVMVYSRMVPIDVVDQVIGGFLRESWRRLEAYIKWKRDAVGSQRIAEWYQWLAEQLAVKTNPRRTQGAYVVFKDWKQGPPFGR